MRLAKMYTVIKRREAAERGLKHFYTGRPCGKGHDCPRFTSTGSCMRCSAEYVKSYVKRMTGKFVATAKGDFSYPLHPDDHAAAMAYCQALDLGRGRVPTVTTAPAAPPPVDIEAIRSRAFGAHLIPPTPGPRTLDPSMAAQLREAGLLK